MIGQRLKDFLEQENVSYETIEHANAYTAQETAASAHIPGRTLAKTVIVKIDGAFAMIVLPASSHIQLLKLKRAIGANELALADEQEFEAAFPDCELGAMPPFGNLYGMPVFVSQALREDEEIAFNAGSHTELVRLPYARFESLVQPTPIPI